MRTPLSHGWLPHGCSCHDCCFSDVPACPTDRGKPDTRREPASTIQDEFFPNSAILKKLQKYTGRHPENESHARVGHYHIMKSKCASLTAITMPCRQPCRLGLRSANTETAGPAQLRCRQTHDGDTRPA